MKRATTLNASPAKPALSLQVEVTQGELVDDVDYLQPYGLASVPPINSDALVAYANNDKSDLICLSATDLAGRPLTLQVAEACLYNQQSGVSITLKNDGTIAIIGNVLIAGNLSVAGIIADNKGTMQAIRTTYNSHTHGSSPVPNQLMSV